MEFKKDVSIKLILTVICLVAIMIFPRAVEYDPTNFDFLFFLFTVIVIMPLLIIIDFKIDHDKRKKSVEEVNHFRNFLMLYEKINLGSYSYRFVTELPDFSSISEHFAVSDSINSAEDIVCVRLFYEAQEILSLNLLSKKIVLGRLELWQSAADKELHK